MYDDCKYCAHKKVCHGSNYRDFGTTECVTTRVFSRDDLNKKYNVDPKRAREYDELLEYELELVLSEKNLKDALDKRNELQKELYQLKKLEYIANFSVGQDILPNKMAEDLKISLRTAQCRLTRLKQEGFLIELHKENGTIWQITTDIHMNWIEKAVLEDLYEKNEKEIERLYKLVEKCNYKDYYGEWHLTT